MRIPAQFRFDGESVDIEWDEALEALVVRPVPANRMDSFFRWAAEQPVPTALPPYTVDENGSFDLLAYLAQDESDE